MKEALDLQPLPWPFMAVIAGFLLYGLWPAVKPEHFRETCVRNMPPRLQRFAYPAEVIRAFGIIWVLMCALMLLLGVAARV
jgi:hypothetical protein